MAFLQKTRICLARYVMGIIMAKLTCLLLVGAMRGDVLVNAIPMRPLSAALLAHHPAMPL